MGLRIFAVDESIAPPWEVHLELTCDGDHGLLPATSRTFTEDGYVRQRAAASKAGWRFTGDGPIFGPCCT